MSPYRRTLCAGRRFHRLNATLVREWLAADKPTGAGALIRSLGEKNFLDKADAAALEREAGRG